MADFALWAAACETGLWPTGTFARAYAANRKAAIEDAIDADPVAACVRELMSEHGSWAGSAGDLLRFGANRGRNDAVGYGPDWPKNPRALAGRLRRAQTFLRAMGIEIAFRTLRTTTATISLAAVARSCSSIRDGIDRR
jgi:hypothetical protein